MKHSGSCSLSPEEVGISQSDRHSRIPIELFFLVGSAFFLWEHQYSWDTRDDWWSRDWLFGSRIQHYEQVPVTLPSSFFRESPKLPSMRLWCKNWQDWPVSLCLYLCNTAWIEYTTFPKHTCWICYIYNLTRLCCRNCIFRVLRWKLIAFSKDLRSTFKFREWIFGSHWIATFKDQPWLLSPKEWMKITKLHFLRFQKTSLPFFWTAFSRDGFQVYRNEWIKGISSNSSGFSRWYFSENFLV